MLSSFFCRSGLARVRPAFRVTTAVFAAALLLSVAGCHKAAVTDPHDPNFIVAEKDHWTITRGELDKEIASYLQENQQTAAQIGPAKMPMLETYMLDNMVLRKLLLAQAATLNLKGTTEQEAQALQELQGRSPTEQDFEAQLKQAGITLDELKKRLHESVLIRQTLQAEALKDSPAPTDADVNAFYLQNKDKFAHPDKIRASRVVILLDAKMTPAVKAEKKKAIEKAYARVKKGEDFGKVATEISEDRYSAPRGGDIGYFQKGENEANFDAVAFNTKQGTVSDVFETPMGYEFLKVTDVRPGGDASLAEVRDMITKYLTQMKESHEEEAYTKNLLDNSGVTFHLVRVNLPTSAGAQQQNASAPADASGAGTPSNGTEQAPQ